MTFSLTAAPFIFTTFVLVPFVLVPLAPASAVLCGVPDLVFDSGRSLLAAAMRLDARLWAFAGLRFRLRFLVSAANSADGAVGEEATGAIGTKS